MLKKSLLGRAGLALACWGMAVPQCGALAADRPAGKAAAAPARPAILDVALNSEGLLAGKVVDAQGKALDATAVTVRQGTREVARAETSSDGTFTVGGLRGGVYQIGAGQNVETFRVWTQKAAPPSARETALIVSKPGVVRGQLAGGGFGGLAVGGLVAGGVGLGFGVAGYQQAQNAQDDADKANDQLQAYINSQSSSP